MSLLNVCDKETEPYGRIKRGVLLEDKEEVLGPHLQGKRPFGVDWVRDPPQ